ncbi:PAS domain S-box/diguanylate cyclase (GGDEF) domain-containing protein [Burkholderiales bacterium JOSHI_001]|nr:PAS domain S-box/diguanylate cyclase (GGDEF) domain-containing protein [Burkholderiales bacterium JOSHI_001]
MASPTASDDTAADVRLRADVDPAAHDELQRFRLLADHVPALIAYYERNGFTCLWSNRAYAHTFGFTPESIVGRSFADVVGPEAALLIQPHVDAMLAEGRTAGYERHLTTASGEPRWISVSLVPHRPPDGDIVGAFVLISDITRHHLAEAALRESEDRMAKFMQASVEGIIFHRDGVVSDANAALLALLNAPFEAVVGRHILDFVAPAHRARAQAIMAAGRDVNYEIDVLDSDGQVLQVEVMGRTITRRGEALRMVIVRDIRARLAAQARIHHLAHHDALTGLPNRLAFEQQLEQTLAGGRTQAALLFVDLDHFKRVNDSLGHLAGDALLRTVAERLLATLRPGDVVGRFGGDEFMVLLPDVVDPAVVEDVVQRLLHAIEVPMRVQGQAISVTPSIGVALYPRDAASAEELIKNADTAMYLAKTQGRAGCRFFEPDMAAQAFDAIVLEGDFARALERGELMLMLQPRQHLQPDGPAPVLPTPGAPCAARAVQALLRWQHPQRGLLAPESFNDVALERRMVQPLAQWAVGEALRLGLRWRGADAASAAPTLVLDLSPLPLTAAVLAEAVAAALAGHSQGSPLPAGWLALDLSERMLAEGLDDAGQPLQQLARLGVALAVSDFGSGQLPLSQLPRLPVRCLRLGAALVGRLPQDGPSTTVAGAIVQMACGLGLEVCADGVSTPAQRDWLRQQGCTMVQGPLVARPMPPAMFEDWQRAPPA